MNLNGIQRNFPISVRRGRGTDHPDPGWRSRFTRSLPSPIMRPSVCGAAAKPIGTTIPRPPRRSGTTGSARISCPKRSHLNNDSRAVTQHVKEAPANAKTINYTFPFDFDYDDFPDDITLYFTTNFETKAPFVGLTWITPDGNEIAWGIFRCNASVPIGLTQDQNLTRKLDGTSRLDRACSAIPQDQSTTPVKGQISAEN